jgi:hypothetical protein
MKNLIFILSVVLLITSCSGPLKKPIVEPLTVDELRSATKKDTAFIEFYEKVQDLRKSFFSNEMNQVKYGDITYKQLRKFLNYQKDTTFTKPIIEKAKVEWEERFGNYQQKLDSISDYWTKYMAENSLNSYVNIEFDHLYREYYSYSRDVRNVYLALKLTPLQGTIQQISFTYKVKSKLKSDERESIYSSIFDDNRGSCITTSPFSKAVVRNWEVGYALEKTLKYMSSDEFKRDYDITFEVTKIRVNDTNISEDDLLIPEVIKDYLKYPSLYEDDVVKQFINKEFISEWEFYRNAINDILKKKDEKCFNFLQDVYKYEDD